MLSNVRKKIVQKDIKKSSKLRIWDWWNMDIVSYLHEYSHLGNQRYSTEAVTESFENSKLIIQIPYYQVGNEIYNLIPCSGGTFIKGSDKQKKNNPPQEMKIEKSFLLGETEVTQELYQAITGQNPSTFSKFGNNPKNPVDNRSWYDALIFCNKLSDIYELDRYYIITKQGKPIKENVVDMQRDFNVNINKDSKGFRLPTEWEWEYAAKAGTQLKYSGSDDANKVGWHEDNSGNTTHPVKQKKPNAWGFYDMSGNVAEWCENSYDGNASYHVYRGGNWGSGVSNMETTFRNRQTPHEVGNHIGFRVCRYI